MKDRERRLEMSERITQVDLDAYEADATGSEDLLRRDDVLSLIAEVRRLRGLIMAVANPKSSDGSIDFKDGRDYEQGICQWCGVGLNVIRNGDEVNYEDVHAPSCGWIAVQIEARTIREEIL